MYAYALGAEVEDHVDVPVSIDVLQGRLCRSGLCADGAKADCAGFDCGGIKGGRRQNGHWRHSPTLEVDTVREAARLDVNRDLELRRRTTTLVARQGEVKTVASICTSRRYEFAIGLDSQGESHVKAAGEVSGDPAAATEGRVQAAIRVITRQGEVKISAGICIPRYHQLAISLDGEGAGLGRVAREVSGDPAVAVEGGVQTAVGVVACQGEIKLSAGRRIPCYHQLTVSLDGEGEDLLRAAGEVGGDPAVAVKGGVQAAIGVIARQGEVKINAGKRTPRHHQFAIGLDGKGEGHIRAAGEVGGDPAVEVESGVQAAVGVVARQGEVKIAKADARAPRHHQLAVGLDDESENLGRAAGEVSGDPAAAAEGGV